MNRDKPLPLDDALAMLPRVGDARRELPTLPEYLIEGAKPQRCVVEYVNPRGLWYWVRFESGLTECYKVPKQRRRR